LAVDVIGAADGGIHLTACVHRRNGSADDWRPTGEGFTIPLPKAAGDPLEVFIAALRNGTRFYGWDIVRLVRLNLWPAVMARVIELGYISEQARLDFALAMPSPTLFAADHGGDENAWLDAMRILLPTYRGPALRLFRGQSRN
jgi:hypothetical protein